MSPDQWSPALKLAIACRKLASEDHALTLAGQATCRADDTTYWSTPLAGGFSNVTESRIVRVDGDMNLIEGTERVNPGVRFHMWIYRARRDINAIVHTHPPYASALSMTGEPLEVAHMDACPFYGDCAFLRDWPGVPVADDEGRIIAEALGDNRAILLANHGYLTVGATFEEAAYLAVLFENAARMHMLARAAGPIKPVEPHHAQEAHDFLLRPDVVNGTFEAWGLEMLRDHPDVADG